MTLPNLPKNTTQPVYEDKSDDDEGPP